MSTGSEKTPLFFWEGDVKNDHEEPRATLRVQRPVYQTEELNEMTTYEYPRISTATALKNACCPLRPKKWLYDTIPILKWLPDYQFKRNIIGDVLSGITVATIHIPHGLAYAILGNVPPIVGIYMGFFPVLVYFVFGTSRHVSIGTFAIVCLMIGRIVSEYSPDDVAVNGTTVVSAYTPVEVATTVTFTVSVIQMVMYLFRLGIITTLLSETLVNAFTCGATFHVVIMQFKDLFGLTLPRRNGAFRMLFHLVSRWLLLHLKQHRQDSSSNWFPHVALVVLLSLNSGIFQTLYDVGTSIQHANVTSVVISSIFLTILVVNNEILKPICARWTKIPFPIEFVAIIAGTAISYVMNLNENYAITIVGNVPTGLPRPDLPVFSLMPSVVVAAFVISMVSYTTTMSLALIVAQKTITKLTQTKNSLLCLSNCLGSFFSCMPVAASLSRTMIQQAVGGVTQIASVVSCFLLLFVLLWLGPLFESLPRCVLASVIVVSLMPLILQLVALKKYWKLSKWDASIWIVTFFTTIIVDIDYGLLAGILTSVTSILIQGQKSYTCLLGVVPNTDLYLDLDLYKNIEEVPGIKIFHYSGSLNFASASYFPALLFKKTNFDPLVWYTKRNEATATEYESRVPQCVILDFTALTYIDPSGVEILRTVLDSYRSVDVTMYICACSGPVFETFKRCIMYDGESSKFTIFPTVHDAVLYSQSVANTMTT